MCPLAVRIALNPGTLPGGRTLRDIADGLNHGPHHRTAAAPSIADCALAL